MNLRKSALLAAACAFGLILAGCGGARATATPAPVQTQPAGDAAKGKVVWRDTCAECHGLSGRGSPAIPKDITRVSAWMKQQSDADLVAYVQRGRPADDPLNTTRIEMPPRGGNPDLTDEDLVNAVAYLRTLLATGK